MLIYGDIVSNTGRPQSGLKDPVALFRAHGGQLRMSEALRLGINRYQIYKMRDEGVIEPVSRGLYRLTSLPPVSHPDLVSAAARYPHAVLCLVSALSWHEITTQIPHRIDLAVDRDARLPAQDYPPVRGYRFSGERFTSGIEQHKVDGVTINVYSVEKTLADCFRFRNRLGKDIVLEALKLYPKRHTARYDAVLKFARICRVESVMRPYLEATQ